MSNIIIPTAYTPTGQEFANLFIQAQIDSRKTETFWVDRLVAAGVRAAHPDDGWVDRVNNSLLLVYPQFNLGVGLGDEVVLGWPDKYRLIRIVAKQQLYISVRYWFDVLPVEGPPLIVKKKHWWCG